MTRQATGYRLDRALDVTVVVKDTYWKHKLRTGYQNKKVELRKEDANYQKSSLETG